MLNQFIPISRSNALNYPFGFEIVDKIPFKPVHSSVDWIQSVVYANVSAQRSLYSFKKGKGNGTRPCP